MNVTAIVSVIIAVLASGGLCLCIYIHYHKRMLKPLVCPIGYHCDTVIHSDYSKFVGIPVELIGILYYSIIILAYLALAMNAGFMASVPLVLIRILSGAAFGFSMYLIGVQMFILKQWCSWCLASAALCTGIFLLTFF